VTAPDDVPGACVHPLAQSPHAGQCLSMAVRRYRGDYRPIDCESPPFPPKRLKNRAKWPTGAFLRDCDLRRAPWMMYPPFRRRSPIAQLVEHSTVNRIVAGSSPARGASTFSTDVLALAPLSRGFCVVGPQRSKGRSATASARRRGAFEGRAASWPRTASKPRSRLWWSKCRTG
jgi:hypothetical protein